MLSRLFGLITRPQSCAHTIRRTHTRPVSAVDLHLGDHGDRGSGAIRVRDAPPGEDAPAAYRPG